MQSSNQEAGWHWRILEDHCLFLQFARNDRAQAAILAGTTRRTHMERIDHLAALLAELSDRDGGYGTDIPGLYISKLSTTSAPRNTVDHAVFCVVAQGVKSIVLNNERYVYDRSTYLVVSLDMPLVSEIVEATKERPFLGVSMELDLAEIGSLLLETEVPSAANAANLRSLFVSPLGDDLLDAVIRLIALLRKPAHIATLAPLIRREIFFHLVLSEHSGLLRRMIAENSQARRIATGIAWLKKNALRPVRMHELARELNMSPSSMHSWFKAVTTMSPLQFQKQLRLQEARRILLSESTDAATVSQRVGYESPSQFSREYRRLFGLPPLRDIERLRSVADGLHAPLLKINASPAVAGPA